MSRKENRIVPTISIVSPIDPDFPRSTKNVKTLVVAFASKLSEFSFELSLTAEEIYELDSEPMSDSFKVAAMQNGSLPTEWLVCVTAARERRLIKKCLVERVNETEARMFQLKKASEVMIDALFHKRNTTEIGAQIYELIGTDGQLMKYFADQLIEAMQNSDCHRRRAMAAAALSHYMTENRDFINFVESKVEHFVKFVNEIHSDQSCPPKIVDYVCTLLADWCIHFDSHKEELAQLLNDMTSGRNFKKNLLEIIRNPPFFDTEEKRKKLKEAVQSVSRAYLKSREKADQVAGLLVNRMEEVLKSDRVKQIYLSCLGDMDKDREYHQWFRPNEHRETAPPPGDRPIQQVVLVGRSDNIDHPLLRPPIAPKPSKELLSCLLPPEEPKPPVPPRRTVNDVKKKGERVSDPINRFSLDSKIILGVMEQYLPKIMESDMRCVKYLDEGAYAYTELVKVKGFGLPVVSKIMKNGRNVSSEVLREQANLLKCIHHPHIVSIHGRIVNSRNFSIGILMEYMELGNLASCSHLIYQLLCFRYGSNLGRKLRKENMLLTSKGGQKLLKLGDFGMLKAIKSEQNGGSKSVFGTYGYNAPETWFWSDSPYSTGVDIYAFAVTIWEMCQRRRPHLDENLESCDGSQMKSSLRPKLEKPKYPWMPKLVTKMWQTNPSSRYTITQVDKEIKTLLDL